MHRCYSVPLCALSAVGIDRQALSKDVVGKPVRQVLADAPFGIAADAQCRKIEVVLCK